MTVPETLWLLAAAFAAGAINAVAGGGSLISFPSLLAVGIAAKAANVTNSVALWPGYVGGSWAYRTELGRQRRVLRTLTPACLGGAVVGAWLLLATPESSLRQIIPLLILTACGLIAFQDRIAEWEKSISNTRREQAGPRSPRDGATAPDAQGNGSATEPLVRPAAHVAVFLLGIYGAYFGAALGIMLLAVLGVLLPDDLQHTNALKGMLSLIINAAALVYFSLFGPVLWPVAAMMAFAALIGGYAGVGVARRIGRAWLRRVVVVYGLVAALAIWVKS